MRKLLPGSQVAARDTRNGSRYYSYRVEDRGPVGGLRPVSYTGVEGRLNQAVAKRQNAKVDLRTYFVNRVAQLSDRLLDATKELSSEDSIRQDKDFADDIDRRLKNGAKFVPRKRQPR
jgi:hypothetical protein